MADKETVNRYAAADGRRIEQRVAETENEAGHKERVVETHVENIPYVLDERVIEKVVPIVTERRKEKYRMGELVDTHIEQVDDESLHLNPAAKVVTKEDVEEAVKKAFAGLSPVPTQTMKRPVKKLKITEPVAEEEEEVVMPVPSKPSKISELIDTGLYVILSGELAFIVYQLFLRGMLER